MAANTSGAMTTTAMSAVTAAAARVRPLWRRAARNNGQVAMASTVAHASAGRNVASIQIATATRPRPAATPARYCALVCDSGFCTGFGVGCVIVTTWLGGGGRREL